MDAEGLSSEDRVMKVKGGRGTRKDAGSWRRVAEIRD